jgi:hypothetical protein
MPTSELTCNPSIFCPTEHPTHHPTTDCVGHPIIHPKPLHMLPSIPTSMTYDQTHLGSQSSNLLSPTSQPTFFLLLNLITNRMRRPPRDPPSRQDAPPNSSATKYPATFHAKHCITSLALDSQMPLPSQFPVPLPTITIQAPSLKLNNTAMAWCTLSPKKPSHSTES